MMQMLYLVKHPKVILPIIRARKNGIVIPIIAYQEALRAGIGYALACAILMRETSGGHNIFGHDPTIYIGAGVVTKKKYLKYRILARKTGKRQGVGSPQLTSAGYQDRADKFGGCWNPRYSCRVAFEALHGLIKQHGLHNGVKAYNGSGPRAEAYANAVLASRNNWTKILTGKGGLT